MSGQTSTSSLRVVLENPAQPAARRQPPSCSIPENEEEWQSIRLQTGLDTLGSILGKVSSLVESWDRRELQEWEKIVIVAATIVDLRAGHDEKTLRFGELYAGRMTYETYRRDRAAVLNLIRLFDRLYAGLEHRAFEFLIIWSQ
ncbi:unnamed protein product [Fusarium graminearum]|nr:unnamed protein product [Fusarium graminearum]